MKTKKYGYGEFKEPVELRYAVMVAYPTEEEGKVDWLFVTDIEYHPRSWWAKKGKEAIYWSTRKEAQEFCVQLSYRGFAGFVVECLEDMHLTNNK